MTPIVQSLPYDSNHYKLVLNDQSNFQLYFKSNNPNKYTHKYSMDETWTLSQDLRRRLNAFGTKSLRRILRYRWWHKVSNDRLLKMTGMRYVTCIIRERQLRQFGHVARFPESDSVRQILTAEDPIGARCPRGRPQLT